MQKLVLVSDSTVELSIICKALIEIVFYIIQPMFIELRNLRTWLASRADISSSKMFVAFPIFSGDECEDVPEFISN